MLLSATSTLGLSKQADTPVVTTYLSGTGWMIEMPTDLVVINFPSTLPTALRQLAFEKFDSAHTKKQRIISIQTEERADFIEPLSPWATPHNLFFYGWMYTGAHAGSLVIPTLDDVHLQNGTLRDDLSIIGIPNRHRKLQVILRLPSIAIYHPGESRSISMPQTIERLDIGFVPVNMRHEDEQKLMAMLPCEHHLMVSTQTQRYTQIKRFFRLRARRKQAMISRPRHPGHAFLFFSKKLS